MTQTEKTEKRLEHITHRLNFFNKKENKLSKFDKAIFGSLFSILGAMMIVMSMTAYMDSTHTSARNYLRQDMDKIVISGDFSHETIAQYVNQDIKNHPVAFSILFTPINKENWESPIYNRGIPEAFNRWSKQLEDEKDKAGNNPEKLEAYNTHYKQFENNYNVYINQIKQYMKATGKVYDGNY
jgi:hypothetical protein